MKLDENDRATTTRLMKVKDMLLRQSSRTAARTRGSAGAVPGGLTKYAKRCRITLHRFAAFNALERKKATMHCVTNIHEDLYRLGGSDRQLAV